MAGNLIYNGSLWTGRTGLNSWGSFYTQVSPAYSSDGTCLTIDKTWGSRMVEMSGRIRGLSGYGTVQYNGTLSVTFPATTISGTVYNYFSFIPIVDILLTSWDGTNYDNSEKLNPDNFRQRGITKGWINQYHINPRFYLNAYIQVRNITNTGFYIVYYAGAETTSNRTIIWHAFGV